MHRKWHLLLSFMILLMLSGTLTVKGNVSEIPGEIQTLDQGGEDPPTIEWWGIDMENITGWVMAWDGIYDGQTEQVWSSTHWVNDSDGIDTVIYQYRWWNDVEWMNRTPELIQSNATYGQYDGNLTYRVWWDWETNQVATEGGSFWFRIFANDTLGNWRTTPQVGTNAGYIIVNPPFGAGLPPITPLFIVITAVVVIAVMVKLVLRKPKGAT